ncbi:MAG: hypothetical protein ABSA42_10880 [Terracidiphilus sp.]|jgi:hypothetical protein
MSNNAYSVYGLRIHAEIACPELPFHPQPDGNPDVTIRLLPPLPSTSESPESGCYEVRPGVFRLVVKGVGRYLVEDGKRISIEPLAGSSNEEVRLFLLGSVIGALLYQRGLFPLHGSAVETRWGAMIFVGAQGIGKSTLAAQFYRRGYRLLSDDVCAVTTSDGKLQVLPALSHFRLCADAYERLAPAQDACFNPAQNARFNPAQDARFSVDKFVIPMNEGYCSAPAPLKAIHILADQEDGDPQFEIIRGFDRVQRLLENLYRPQYLKGQETQSDLMRLAGQIAQETPMVKVSRKRDPELIDGLIDFLEAAWAEHFGSKPREEKK